MHALQRQYCLGLFFYNELLQTFYRLRICDYKYAGQHIDKLDAAMKSNMQREQHIKELITELDVINKHISRTDLQHKETLALYEKQRQLHEQLNVSFGKVDLELPSLENASQMWGDKLELAPPPIDGEWLPKSAVYALIDLMVVIFGRPKGLFKECGRRIQSGLHVIQGEFASLIFSLFGQSIMLCLSAGVASVFNFLACFSCQAEATQLTDFHYFFFTPV